MTSERDIEDVEGLPMEGEPEETSSENKEEVEDIEEVVEVEVQEEEAKEEVKAEKSEESTEEKSEEEEPERHKQTSKERREKRRIKERRTREERDFLLQQVNDLTQRLAAVETGSIQTRLGLVDSQMSECLNDVATAEDLELTAQQQGDWDGVKTARRLREAAQQRAGLFKNEKERLSQFQAQPPRVAPSPGAAEIQRLSADFRADKPWLQFGANGIPLNPETAVALSIDHALKKEGRLSEFDENYWQELDKRVKAALPFMGKKEAEELDDDEVDVPDETKTEVRAPKPPVKREARRGPAVGSSGAQAASGAVRRRVSPERVAALKEIGAWDDPKLRAEYLKEYDDWDKAHGVQQ